jgi:hypothetical protein
MVQYDPPLRCGTLFIKEEEMKLEGDKIVFKFVSAGDDAYARELCFIKTEMLKRFFPQ